MTQTVAQVKDRILSELPSTKNFTAQDVARLFQVSCYVVRRAFQELAEEQRVFVYAQPKQQPNEYRLPPRATARHAPLGPEHEDVRSIVARAGKLTRGTLINRAATHTHKPAKDIEKLIDDLHRAGVLKCKIVGVTTVISLEAA